MTCVVGLIDNGTVYIGGDSVASDGNSLLTTNFPKVFRIGKLLFGFSGSYRGAQLVKEGLRPPPHFKALSDYQYIVTKLVPTIAAVYEKGGFCDESGTSFLIGYRGRLYWLVPGFNVYLPVDNYHATGSSTAYVLGSLHASADTDWTPRHRLQVAFEAAAYYDIAVRGPFVIEELA